MALRIRKLETREDVYDITVQDNHNFYANDILVHNCEITLPTEPVSAADPEAGEIALCTLSATNWGLINKPEDFEKPCRLAVEALDALLDYQQYPLEAARKATMWRRPLGIGIINLAYFLAKRGLRYDSSALETVHEYAEAWSYYLIKASADLAERKGAPARACDTKYHKGILPIDTYKASVDELVKPVYRMPWDSLREQLGRTSIRNSTLMALMPAECQSLDNQVMLENGDSISLGELIQDLGKIDVDAVHESQAIGQRYTLSSPVRLAGGITAHECYYNGPASVTEIEMEDGSIYRFTENHQLLVNRNGKETWVLVADLHEDDDIVGFDGK